MKKEKKNSNNNNSTGQGEKLDEEEEEGGGGEELEGEGDDEEDEDRDELEESFEESGCDSRGAVRMEERWHRGDGVTYRLFFVDVRKVKVDISSFPV
jgi:hypothetical protein